MEEMTTKICPCCVAENPKESKFCINCGNKFEEPEIRQEIDIHYEDAPIEITDTEPTIYTDKTVYPDDKENNGNIGFAIASMVCGIMSLLCCCTFLGLVLGIAAIVLAIITLKNKYDGKGMAIAGIVTGGIGIFIWLLFMAIGGLSFVSSELSGY